MTDSCREALQEVRRLLESIEDPIYAKVLTPSDEIRLRAILYRLVQLEEEPIDRECVELLEYAREVVEDIRSRAFGAGSQ